MCIRDSGDTGQWPLASGTYDVFIWHNSVNGTAPYYNVSGNVSTGYLTGYVTVSGGSGVSSEIQTLTIVEPGWGYAVGDTFTIRLEDLTQGQELTCHADFTINKLSPRDFDVGVDIWGSEAASATIVEKISSTQYRIKEFIGSFGSGSVFDYYSEATVSSESSVYTTSDGNDLSGTITGGTSNATATVLRRANQVVAGTAGVYRINNIQGSFLIGEDLDADGSEVALIKSVAPVPVKEDPSPENNVAVIVPSTSNFVSGIVLPIPTLVLVVSIVQT